MTKKDEATYLTVLLEQVRDQNKAVLEDVGDIQKNTSEIPGMREDIVVLKQDMKVVKAVIADTSAVQHKHSKRLARLESMRR